MNNKIKILHLSSPGYRTAGKLAFDIHKKFLDEGHESFIISKELNGRVPNSFSYHNKLSKWINRKITSISLHFRRIFKSKDNIYEKYAFIDLNENRDQKKYHSILKKVPFKPQIIMLYAMQGFLNAKTIHDIQKKSGAKVYWLLYDMFAFTGGCHYSWSCKGFHNNCGECPALFSVDKKDISYKNLLFKKNYLLNTEINIFPVSYWLRSNAEKSSIFKNSNLIDWMIPQNLEIFKPKSKNDIKIELGLDQNKKYLLFGAVNLQSERKGFTYLVDALKIINTKNIEHKNFEILIIGMKSERIELKTKFKVHELGLINNKDLLAKYYQVAHLVVIPSVQDAGPLMLTEAIASGVPVVSFEMGYAKDFIINGKTGYIAELYDSNDLSEKIIKILSLTDDEYKVFLHNCRKIAEENLDFNNQFYKLVDIFTNSLYNTLPVK